ncbi:gliding motility-associated C-terminal domain-containing protein [Flavobacterium agricola]|uniref:Gliding motility-associated C-terminal domain-containing protein n=1 Tax=Flavobacterium agricola TaxID=2870839 RepID=A0ABY6M0Z0_9FLAO|nr:CshA/CshB family fibrillar adhesin-related protein [Flavobacterium agricola]UYW01922.1 gliding motility-associated C-terminal domain-containing protein [Flavobacterium agricola]
MMKFKWHMLLFFFLITSGLWAQDMCSGGTAAYATGGKSVYRDQVLWLTWGGAPGSTGANGATLNLNSKSRASFELAGQTMCFECEIVKKSSAGLISYAPGDWGGDSLDDFYNIGGTGGSNRLVNGVMVKSAASQFTLRCTAKLDNQPYKIKGVVMADAESMNNSGEYLKATAQGSWKIVDMEVKGSGPYNISKHNLTDNKQQIAFTRGNDNGAAAITFLSFNPEIAYLKDPVNYSVDIDFDINGGGNTAIAIGLLVPNADAGDAPKSYGDVFHLINEMKITDDGITKFDEVVDANKASFKKGAIVPPSDLFLGSVGPMAERAMKYSADASGDNPSNNLNEEDAIPVNTIKHKVTAGETLSLDIPYVSTDANTIIAGWIDFNQNGTFELGERTEKTFSGSGKGTVTLTWNVPSDFIKGETFVRLRIGTKAEELTLPTGVASDGEIEDHKIFLDDPKFQISKTSNATNGIWESTNNDKKYILTVTNIATVPSYGTIKVLDVLPAGITPSWTGSHISNGWTLTFVGQTITATSTNIIAPKGGTSNIEIPVKVDLTLPSAVYTNKASVGGGGDNDYEAPVDPTTCNGLEGHCAVYDVKVVHPLVANADDFGTINPYTFTSTLPITANDLFKGVTISDLSNFTITLDAAAQEVLTLNENGTVSAKTGVEAKAYTVSYTICENGADPANCKTAQLTFTVDDIKAPITADEELLDVQPNATIQNKVTITPGTGTITEVNVVNKPDDVEVTINTDGTYTIEPGTNYEGGDSFEIEYEVVDSNGLKSTAKITVVFESKPAINLVLTSTISDSNGNEQIGVGDVIVYSYTITNTGNTTLTNITLPTVEKDLVQAADLPESLAPAGKDGSNVTIIKEYIVTQADVDAGLVTNSAVVNGYKGDVKVEDISGTADDNNTASTIELPENPAITLQLTSSFIDTDANGYAEVNETIKYVYTITNTGNVTLSDITIPTNTDLNIDFAGKIPADLKLAPGATHSFEIDLPLTQNHIDAAKVENTAVVSALSPKNTSVSDVSGTTNTSDDVTVEELKSISDIALVLTSTYNNENGSEFAQAGETITYTYKVINTGKTTLTEFSFPEDLLKIGITPADLNVTSLAPNAEATFTKTYNLTQADIDLGKVVNSAKVQAFGPNKATDLVDDISGVDNVSDAINEISFTENPSITLVLESDFNDINSNGFAEVNETIAYNYIITNNGNVTLTDIQLSEELLKVIPAGTVIPDLAPGASHSISVLYNLTQADIDAGQVTNAAKVTGTSPKGTETSDVSGTNDTNNTATTTPLNTKSSINLVLTGEFVDSNSNGFAEVNEVITYTYLITNTGNTTLNNIELPEDVLKIIDASALPKTLAPGESVPVTFDYKLQQADIDAGKVINKDTVKGTPNVGATVEDQSGVDVAGDLATETLLNTKSSINLVLTGEFVDSNSNGFAEVNEVITYTYLITNTGNTTLNNIELPEDVLNIIDASLLPKTLAPGESVPVTFDYKLQQADIDAGKVINKDTVKGTPNVGATVEDQSGVDVAGDLATETLLNTKSSINLVLTGEFVDGNTNGFAEVDEVITYTYVIKNTGNTTLNNIELPEDVLNIIDASALPKTLVPGESVSLTFDYKLQQADIDAGKVINKDTVKGTPNVGEVVEDQSGVDTTSNEETIVNIPTNSTINLVLTSEFVDENTNGFAELNEIVKYKYVITNTGNTTLTNIRLSEDVLNIIDADQLSGVVLNPGESKTLYFDYALTQDDLDNSFVKNTDTVLGLAPNGSDVNDQSGTTDDTDEPTIQPLLTKASLALVKLGQVMNVQNARAQQKGEYIEYTFEVTNTGDVTLENVAVLDKLIAEDPIPVTPSTLTPKQVGRAIVNLKLELAHYNEGSVINSATGVGTTKTGTEVTDISGSTTENDEATVTTLVQAPAIALVKTSVFNDENANGVAELNETITYTFEATNVGNVTLTDVKLSDSFLNIAQQAYEPASINPGETATITVSYTINQLDIDLGLVVNTAEVESLDPNGDLVFDISGTDFDNDETTQTVLHAEPGIAIIKTAEFLDDNKDGTAQVGETIVYKFSIKNTGATTLYNVTVTDDLTGIALKGSPIAELKPGEVNETAYTATYQLLLKDLTNGQVNNQALVTAQTHQGENVTDLSDSDNYSGDATTITYVRGCVIEVFNAVSPNGDGRNDMLYIQGLECYPNNTVEIYNRWGVLVYKTDGYNNQDKAFKGYSEGRATINKGDLLPVGTYFYILRFTDLNQKSHDVQGYLYLNR